MAGRKSDFTLTKLDDLFTTQAQRDEEQLSKIRDIPLELIDDFPDHPFKVRDDEDMMQLVESVKERGVITPATVRQKEDGRYELVSGHRRKRACELAGFETLRSEIVDLNRDEATILMVESNFQRSEILPSEKAFAYKMRLEAMKRQAGRPTKNNLVPVGQNYSREELAAQSGESQTQIQRYIRLTNLVPELLEFVDEGRIKMRPAVELSYLDEDCQRDVVDEIDLNDATPSHDQTIRMRKLFNEGNLTTEAIHAVMSEEKPNQKEKIVLRGDRVRQLIPKNIPVSQMRNSIASDLVTMLDVSPVEVAATDELPYPNMAAFYNNEKQTLYVKRNVGDSVAVAQCVAQELGHAQLSINSESYSRRDMGFQAVCIGYMLCKKYGVDTQNFAINRIPEGLASKEPKEIRAELSKTRNAMAEIHSHISDEMFRKKQERSKDYER